MTLKRYNLYMTQHQKHLHVTALMGLKTLLTLLMNIILCETNFKKFCPHGGRGDKF